jgi:hypothetical protein
MFEYPVHSNASCFTSYSSEVSSPKIEEFCPTSRLHTGTRGQQKLDVEVIITNQKIQLTLTIQSQMSNTPNG